MKTIGSVAAAASILALSMAAAPVSAADMSTRGYAPAPYNAFSWAGMYVGANAGYQFGSVSNSNTSPNGFAGGLQAGYNWQSDRFVYGFETDLQLSGADDASLGLKFSNPWFGTLRGRAGFTANNILFYGTAGFAYGAGNLETAAGTEDHAHFGWAAGAGAEVALTQHWSAKVEYLFVNLNQERYALTGMDHEFESNLLRFGFNYKF